MQAFDSIFVYTIEYDVTGEKDLLNESRKYFPGRTGQMRITLHYLFAALVLTIYGGQV